MKTGAEILTKVDGATAKCHRVAHAIGILVGTGAAGRVGEVFQYLVAMESSQR